MMLNTLTMWAKDHGFQRLYVNSYAKNASAIQYYLNHGFYEIDRSFEKTIE